jgi:hypothetical protein
MTEPAADEPGRAGTPADGSGQPETPARTDPQLSEIVVKYRALGAALSSCRQLQHEVAVLFAGLNREQQQAYIAAVERIEDEKREQETRT